MHSDSTYTKVASHEAHKGEFSRCILLYSGGLDTSVMLKWIQDEYDAEVIALTIDIGQLHEDLEAARQKALKLGAVDAIVVDAKKRFSENVLPHAIKANADYQGGYHLSTPLGRIILSQIAVEVAREHKATVIAHGSTGKGNDQVRFESYITTLDPTMKIIAPVREWGMGRDEELAYAAKHNIPVVQTSDKPYSYDDNMWGSTGEGGEIEDPALIPPLEAILQVCKTPQKAPDTTELVEIEFDQGIPVALNGDAMHLTDIIAEANAIGSEHAIGITHLIEDRLIGLKVRGVYEAPAARLLIESHRNLEKLVCTRELNEFKATIDAKWAYLCYAAKWFDPIMPALHAFQDNVNSRVTGTVKLRLHKGNIEVVALRSPNSLFDARLATFDKDVAFNQNASAGFIEIYNLSQSIAYNRKP